MFSPKTHFHQKKTYFHQKVDFTKKMFKPKSPKHVYKNKQKTYQIALKHKKDPKRPKTSLNGPKYTNM